LLITTVRSFALEFNADGLYTTVTEVQFTLPSTIPSVTEFIVNFDFIWDTFSRIHDTASRRHAILIGNPIPDVRALQVRRSTLCIPEMMPWIMHLEQWFGFFQPV
jgi:hypothetical protein